MIRPAAIVLLGLALPSVLAAQRPDPRGTYEFQSTSTRGDPFEGTVHLYGELDAPTGFVYTTIDAPIPVTGVRWLGTDTLGVRFNLGTTVVTQVFVFDGDAFAGHYSFTREGETRRIALSGRRLPWSGQPDLAPTRCVVAGVRFEARCAMLHVPEDPDDPGGRMIPLRVVILPAEADEPAPDAMFMFAGGPGQAATEVAGGYAGTTAQIRRTRDVVIVDQRGTGASNPLRCEFRDPNDRAQLLLTWRFPPDDLDRCREILSERADLRMYHTWIAAGDIDRVRAWLGYPHINLYGGSYGTRMAQTYLRRFPERTRTVTLRGVAAPDGVLPVDNPGDGQASLELVFEECGAEPACAAAYPDLAGDLATILETLETTPAASRVRDPVTGDSVDVAITRSVFAGALRRLLMDGNAIPFVPLVVHAAAQGDYSALARGIAGTLGISRVLYIGMSLSVGCAEDAPRLTDADIEARTAGTFMGSGPALAYRDACARWPQGDVPPAMRDYLTVDVPVLLLSGRYDPATPVRWGRAVADALPNSLHVIMPGIAHSPFPPCAQDIMTQFVENGGMVGVNTDCVSSLKRAPFRVETR